MMNELLHELAQEREWCKAELKAVLNRDYYNERTDLEQKNDYYRMISFKDSYLSSRIRKLLEETHLQKLSYTPHRYLYPWVDLQEDRTLKSLYSGKRMNPLDVIEEDIRKLEQEVQQGQSGTSVLNCEHVVPQSWFHKKDPMKGDLHHLFACDPGCNSIRGNHPYDDFLDYIPERLILGIKDGCGKNEGGKFEPEYGKGIVARSTLYFLVRYPQTISHELVNISLLLEWHQRFPVSRYELHRNQAIQELQGNRNPFIDYPEYARSMIL